jgi:hypothetical protein
MQAGAQRPAHGRKRALNEALFCALAILNADHAVH